MLEKKEPKPKRFYSQNETLDFTKDMCQFSDHQTFRLGSLLYLFTTGILRQSSGANLEINKATCASSYSSHTRPTSDPHLQH